MTSGGYSTVRSHRTRRLLAASLSALALGSGLGPAVANDVSVGGVSNAFTNFFNLPPFYIYSSTLTTGTPVVVNVDTVALNGTSIGGTVGVNANSSILVNISKDVTNPVALPGVWVFNNGFMSNTDAMIVNVISGAEVSSAANYGIYAGGGFANGPVNIHSDGTGKVNGASSGIVANTTLTQVGLVKVDGFDEINSSAGNGIWIAQYGTGGIEVSGNGDINAAVEGVLTAAVNGNTKIDTTGGKVSAGGDGIAHSWGGYTAGNTGTGAVDIKTGDVDAGLVGVFSYTATGNNKVDTTAGTIDAGTDGVDAWIFGGNGKVDVKTAEVNAVREGVWTRAWDGDTTVDTTAGKVTSTLGDGVVHATLGYLAGSNAGSVDIKTGDVSAALVGVFSYTTTGNNKVDTTAGTIDAGTDGVDAWVFAGDGSVDVKTANVNAVREGVWTRAWDGDTTVDTTAGTVKSTLGDGVVHATVGYAVGSNAGSVDIKTGDVNAKLVGVFSYTSTGDNAVDTTAGKIIAGVDGLAAWSLGGNVDVDAGEIIAGSTGIWTSNTLAGNNDVVAHDDVTGNLTADWGIYSTTVNGDNTVRVMPATIKGNAALEVSTTGTGNVNTTIDAGAIIEGTTWGYVTTTTTGAGVTNNAGTIKTTNDNGLSGDTGLVATIWVKGGTNNTINNIAGGKILGGITDAGVNTVFNNNSGAIWDAALLNAMNSSSIINNAGVINVRQGATVGVGVTNNLAGGLVDLTYGGTSPLATDYFYTYDYNAGTGSKTTFNVDFTLANGSGTEALADDHSSNGLGTADTIGSIGNPTPGAGAVISLVNVGAPGIATSGSIALILPAATAGAGLADPGLGGLPTLIPSANYVLDAGSDFTTGAVKVVLQEDEFGGLYLVWAPNITANSLGGFAGGDLGDPSTGAARMSGAAGIVGGAGGGLGASGGPSGGGAAGQVGDIAAQNSHGQSGASGGAFCGDGSRLTAWTAADGSDAKFSNDTKGWNIGSAMGVDYDVTPDACGQVAVGAFGSFSATASTYETGSSETDSKGAGAYARFSPGNGLYATALFAANWGETELTNNIFGSTAQQSSMGYLVNGAVGYSTDIGDKATVDVRAFASRAWINGDGFSDSAGIVVDGSEADMTAIGAMATLSYDVTEATSAFLSGGGRYVTMDQSITAFGIEVSGSAKATYASVEAGLRHDLTSNATLAVAGNGDFSKNSESWGARIGLAFKF
jgi:hypothetical protein